MPIYEYRCECGDVFESLEKVGECRATCGERCTQQPARGDGKVERVMSGTLVRGDGREARPPSVDVHKRAGRRFDDCA